LQPIGIGGNPGAVNATTGTAELEKYLLDLAGIKDDHGVRIGGLWIGNTNWLMSGGAEPGKVSWDSLFIADLLVDMEKLTGWWKGALFGASFYDSMGSEQTSRRGVFKAIMVCREPNRSIARSFTSSGFDRSCSMENSLFVLANPCRALTLANVLRPVPLAEQRLFIPAVSGLLYTPVFKTLPYSGPCQAIIIRHAE
jgi:porin